MIMGSIVGLHAPPQFYVRWGCRKCGHVGGVARTTIPVDETFRGDLLRTLLDAAKKKIVRVHARGQGCIAVPGDVVLEPYVPKGKDVKGVL